MLNDSTPQLGSGWSNFLLVSVGILLCGGSYIGWVFYSRWEANQAIVEKAAQRERSQDQQTFEAMGGNRFEILSYTADPGTIQAGERTSLCYSVSNANAVKIEPQAEEPVWPAFSRCVHVSPRKTTKYTLTIEDGAGHAKTAIVEVKVQ
jgi:hypothetical protein